MGLADHLGLTEVNGLAVRWWWAANAGPQYLLTPTLPETVALWRRVEEGDLSAMAELVELSESGPVVRASLVVSALS